MSLNLYVYQVDITRLCAVQGSGDRELLLRVIADRQALIEEHDAIYRERFNGYLPLAEAVEQIIEGGVHDQAVPLFQYEHAAVLIAVTLGTPLDSGLLLESMAELWEEADLVLRDRLRRSGQSESALPLIDYLLNRGPAIEAPIDPLNPLGTGYLTGLEVREAKGVLDRMDLEDESDAEISDLRASAIDVVRSYYGWINEGANTDLGLFFHA